MSVTEVEGAVVGHLLLSEVVLRGDDANRVALAPAPMAVLPERQGSGVGGALVRAALAAAEAAGEPLVLVLGHAGYYPRFGFEPARRLGIAPPFGVADEVWLAARLAARDPAWRGTVRYPPAFDAA